MARTATRKPDTILTLNANYPRGQGGTRVSALKYDVFRKAILKVVPRTAGGIAFKDLPAAVAGALTPEQRRTIGSISWYTTTVKLDLEARGLIERLPGVTPQRLRRNR